jgi:hypothetical protein
MQTAPVFRHLFGILRVTEATIARGMAGFFTLSV